MKPVPVCRYYVSIVERDVPEPPKSEVTRQWTGDEIVSVDGQSDWGLREHATYRLEGSEPYLRVQFASVYVSDQERSLSFFVEKLGFHVVNDARFASGRRWIEVAPPDGSTSIALVVPTPGFHEDELVGHSGMLTFLTEDPEQTYRDWSERGVPFSVPPQSPAWGGTFCRFHDPDGNSFVLAGFTDVSRAIDERRRAFRERVENERRAAQELDIARQVQTRLLPQRQPAVPGLDYAGVCVQARQVGGDYYDFLDLGRGNLALIVGDIAGKGMAAALLMASLQASVRSQMLQAAGQPEQLLHSVNRMLFENTIPSAYATLFFSSYDAASGQLHYINCGHLPALVLRADRTVEKLEPACTVLGMFADWSCSGATTIELRVGDMLFIFTDGLTESFNEAEEEFGETRLVEALRHNSTLTAKQLAHSVIDNVLEFSSKRQFDDITFIVARRTS